MFFPIRNYCIWIGVSSEDNVSVNNRERLISNFLSLFSVQIVNYILPLITVPYLVRVLGPEKFGLIAFSQAFIQYFVLVTDYGFNLSVTREISINRDDEEKISKIFSSVMFIKVALMALSFLLLCLLVFSFNKFRTEWLVYLLTFGMVVGNVLFPIWLFQGMERIKQIAALNIVAKAFFTVSVFFFIRSQSDYVYVPLINSLGFIIAGLISLWMISREFGVRYKTPTFAEIKHQLHEGWHIFASTIAISLYTVSNTFILGIFTNNTIVGYFNAGERVIRAVAGLINPLTQTVYPHICNLVSKSKEDALIFIRKIARIASIPFLLISIFFFIFATQISDVILGEQYKESIKVIRILSPLPLIICLTNVFGIQTLLSFGLRNVYLKTTILACTLSIILALFLVKPFQHIGISFVSLIVEFFIASYMFFALNSHGLKVIQFKSIFRFVLFKKL